MFCAMMTTISMETIISNDNVGHVLWLWPLWIISLYNCVIRYNKFALQPSLQRGYNCMIKYNQRFASELKERGPASFMVQLYD